MPKLQVNEFKNCKGLYYIDNVIKEDNNIIKILDKYKWTPLSNSPNSRKVQHYGYKYNYKTYDIYEKCDDFPEIIKKLSNRLKKICLQLKIIDDDYEFNQCIINNYNDNQGISPHIDLKKYGNVIGCYTINSGTTINFSNDDELFDLYVKSNSLYIMSDDSRYKWKHGINVKKNDYIDNIPISRDRRISITFRNVPNK